MNKKHVVVVFSGGLDSTALLMWHLVQRHKVHALSFDYGQRHRRELDSALTITTVLRRTYAMTHSIVDLTHVGQFFGGNSQTDKSIPVPEGHYTDETMKLTVVPNRNMIMLAVATGVAIAEGAGIVSYGAHSGDHAIYPDCRPDFAAAMGIAIRKGNAPAPRLATPFINMSKSELLCIGSRLGAPFEHTWSCYKSGYEYHCGKCGTCVERREAFEHAGVPDPTKYMDKVPVLP